MAHIGITGPLADAEVVLTEVGDEDTTLEGVNGLFLLAKVDESTCDCGQEGEHYRPVHQVVQPWN